jgi:hypothetical protein
MEWRRYLGLRGVIKDTHEILILPVFTQQTVFVIPKVKVIGRGIYARLWTLLR